MCGVFAASIAIAMSPWFVLSDIEYFAVLSIAIAGSGTLLSLCDGVALGDGLVARGGVLRLGVRRRTAPTEA